MSDHRGTQEKKSGSRLWLVIFFVALGGVAVWGVLSRISSEHNLKVTTEQEAIPSVAVRPAEAEPKTEDLVLPGNVEAWHEAPIYARTAGYLKAWYTDIGSHVKAGDLLAEIDAPEVDAQLHQAEADLNTAEANNQLAQSTAKRWETLLQTHSVSRQEADEKSSAASANAALVAASKANVDRLKQLEDFKRVVAPFDGTITARNTDTGALINPGSSGTVQPLFAVADTTKLRVYVRVPENYTPSIKPDLTADLFFPAYPKRSFDAKLSRTADALDPTTRTLLIELEVDNDSGELMPGGYTEVHLKLPASGENIKLPANELLFRDGPQAAIVGDDGKVVLKNIVIGRDYGKSLEVVSGLAVGDRVVVNPPDSMAAGQQVRIIKPDEQKKADDANGDKKADGDQKRSNDANATKAPAPSDGDSREKDNKDSKAETHP